MIQLSILSIKCWTIRPTDRADVVDLSTPNHDAMDTKDSSDTIKIIGRIEWNNIRRNEVEEIPATLCMLVYTELRCALIFLVGISQGKF